MRIEEVKLYGVINFLLATLFSLLSCVEILLPECPS